MTMWLHDHVQIHLPPVSCCSCCCRSQRQRKLTTQTTADPTRKMSLKPNNGGTNEENEPESADQEKVDLIVGLVVLAVLLLCQKRNR